MKSALSKFFIVVAAISGVLALINSASFFTSLVNKPPGTIYLGTIHYWEDYLFYLNHFFQGAHGAWLTHNRFTTDILPSSFIYWNNVYLGKLGGVLGLSPIISYNLSVLLLAFSSLVLLFVLFIAVFKLKPVTAFIAFLFAAFSTSLPNIVTSNEGTKIIWPYQIWGTPHFAFDRLGGAPNHLERTVGFYILLLVTFIPVPKNTKQRTMLFVAGAIIAALYATVNPIQSASFAALLCGIVILRYIFTRKPPEKYELYRYILIMGVTAVFYFLTSRAMDVSPYKEAKVWEELNQSRTTFFFLLASIGPILFFALTGLASRIKKLTQVEVFGALFLLISYIVFMSPIPKMLGVSNLRVLFPALYIFWGVFAALGFQSIAEWASKKIRIDKKISMIILSFIIVFLTIPSLWWEIGWKFPKTVDMNDPLLYLPSGVFEGFTFLSARVPYDDVTLANPVHHMDSLVPALAGHTTYTGHIAATLNKDGKITQSLRFFTLQMTQTQALAFLNTNRIRYIVFTMYDGDRIQFERTYPFLTKIYENTETVIYEMAVKN